MPLSFPNAPTLNQSYTVGTKTWVWNGNAWALSSSLPSLVVTGNITIGNGTVTGGTHTFVGNISPSSSNTYTLGNTTNWWNTIWGESVNALYADLAEKYTSDSDYPPGTVVVFGGEKEVTISKQSHDPRIAGVVSTRPAYLMNTKINGVAVSVALQGRVPTQVQGPVKKGDRLVASDTPGVAQNLMLGQYQPGCIIGKTLEDIEDNTIKTIEVVVGRL